MCFVCARKLALLLSVSLMRKALPVNKDFIVKILKAHTLMDTKQNILLCLRQCSKLKILSFWNLYYILVLSYILRLCLKTNLHGHQNLCNSLK